MDRQRRPLRRLRRTGEPISTGLGACGAVSSGGGFFTYGPATVTGSTFTNNHAYDSGGGFFASEAQVDDSTFTGNNAGGESEEALGASAAQLPAPLSDHAGASEIPVGSQYCLCVGGGFAVGVTIGTFEVPEGGTQVTGSTFVANGAGCDQYCLGAGGGFFAAGGANVSGSTFGDPSDPENGSNAAGCFAFCGAFGGGFYSADSTNVDTSTFVLNGNGCLSSCGAEGGGFYAGNGLLDSATSDALSGKLSSKATAQLVGGGSVDVVQSTFSLNEAGCILGGCGGSGGGFFSSDAPTVDVTASTFNGNDALYDGGALSVNGGIVLTICAGECGGTDTTITNSTVTGNVSGFPAAISVAREGDTLTLVNDTIDSNSIVPREDRDVFHRVRHEQGTRRRV